MQTGHNNPPAYSLLEPLIRDIFVEKVFMILGFQSLLMFLMTLFFQMNPSWSIPIILWINSHWFLFMIPFFGLTIALSFSESLRKTYPQNYLALGGLTFMLSLMTSITTLAFDTDVVVISLGLVVLTLFGFYQLIRNTNYDFTSWEPVFSAGLFSLILAPFLAYLFGFALSEVVMAVFGLIVFLGLLIADLQMIISGNHKYKIGLDEEVLAALILYLDLLNLFLRLLKLLQWLKDFKENINKDSRKGKF